MKKIALVCMISSLLLAGQTPLIFAVDSTQAPIRVRNEAIRTAQEEYREDRKTAVDERKETKDREAFKESMEDNREIRRSSISGARQTFRTERARIHGERLARHFAFYEQRFNNIATRLQTRIDKEKAEGADVTQAQENLTSAQSLLAVAVADGKKAVEMFANITQTTWDIQQPEIKSAIDQAHKARKGFVEARMKLVSVLQALAVNK